MSDVRALAWGKRIDAQFALHATALDLLRSGVTRHLRGIFVVGTISVAGSFYDANEEVGLIKPALSVYVQGADFVSDPPLLNDTFFHNGRQFTVRKTWSYYQADTVVLVLALCD